MATPTANWKDYTYEQIMENDYFHPPTEDEALLGVNRMSQKAEFGEFNYYYCRAIVMSLMKWEYRASLDYFSTMTYDGEQLQDDSVYLCPQELQDEIGSFAKKIYERGGMTALRANYYIMINIMRDCREDEDEDGDETNYTSDLYHKINDLKVIFSRYIDEWQY